MPHGLNEKLRNGTLDPAAEDDAEGSPGPEPLLDEFGDGFPLLAEDGDPLLPED